MKSRPLSEKEIYQLQLKIAHIETLSSVEFKIVFSTADFSGFYAKAPDIFKRYGLDDVKGGNAVLLLINHQQSRLVLLGDDAIQQRMGKSYWRELEDLMTDAFSSGQLFASLSACLGILGHQLARFYPVHGITENRIANRLVFED